MYYLAMTITVHEEYPFLRYFGTNIQPSAAPFLVELETPEQMAAKMKPAVFTPRNSKYRFMKGNDNHVLYNPKGFINLKAVPRHRNQTDYRNAVFWDVTPCDCCKNRRFGGA
jgi:hypothetical protein